MSNKIHNLNFNSIHNNIIYDNVSQKFIKIYDNFGHDITIIRDSITNFEMTKQTICNEMEVEWNIKYYPANLRLYNENNQEILNINDIARANNIKIIVIPIFCNIHLK